MMKSNEQNNQISSNPKQFVPADESPLDLYTIPLSSGWFAWDSIHDNERAALWEFFDGSSFTRTPRIYKEYRDFIINKFREDPSTKLLFTDVRKSLVGDVCLLRKVFGFLEKWGLINFNVGATAEEDKNQEEEEGESDGIFKVRVEEGAPVGVRVVAVPNSLKPLVAPPLPDVAGGIVRGVVSNRFKSPLASYSDVFGILDKEIPKESAKEFVCRCCGEKSGSSKCYESTKEKYQVCQKCIENQTLGEHKSVDDFKLNDLVEITGDQGVIWSETETLLLLESISKYGDDWDLVAQNVQTKTKQQCISKFIELPFGELMLDTHAKHSTEAVRGDVIAVESEQLLSSEHQEVVKNANDGSNKAAVEAEHNGEEVVKNAEDNLEKVAVETEFNGEEVVKNAENGLENAGVETEHNGEEVIKNMDDGPVNRALENEYNEEEAVNNVDDGLEKAALEIERNGEAEDQGPPLKKQRMTLDLDRSLMKQVALVSTMVSPRVTVAAADAAVLALCDGNPLVSDIFYAEDDSLACQLRSGNLNSELERALQPEKSEMKDDRSLSGVDNTASVKDTVPLALRMRAGVATALGAAAAHARFLAEREEREMEHLMATIIETQLKKLWRKMKHFDDLESIMEKEHAHLEELKETILAERIAILQKIFSAGIPRLKDITL
ncbi:SWI/SNF complex subunit SWI3A-like protein [Drosera capensis]